MTVQRKRGLIQMDILNMFWNVCPCCGAQMVSGSLVSKVPQPLTRTRGHFVPKAFQYHQKRFWSPQCHSCNQAQGTLTLLEWRDQLRQEGDPRATRIDDFIMKLGRLGVSYPQIGGLL